MKMLKAAASNVRRLARVFKHSPPALLLSDRFHLAVGDPSHLSDSPSLPKRCHLFSGANLDFTRWSLMPRASFSSEAVAETKVQTTGTVKELYDKILKSANVQRTAPPNTWLWSLIANCANVEDIKLLFDVLQNLRRFRLSNLRIHQNYNENLCREVAKACVRAGAIDFGKKTLWKHNVYGITPSIWVSAPFIVMKLLKKNDVQLQAGIADLVFSICYQTDKRDLISMYSKRFIREGVKLRETSFTPTRDYLVKNNNQHVKAEELKGKVVELETEAVKELKLDMLCHPNTVLRSINGHSRVSFKELFGKKIMFVLEKFDPKNRFGEDPAFTKFALMLKGRFSQTWGTDDEFEVIRIIEDNTESDTSEQLDLDIFTRKHADMEWLVMLASELKINLSSSHYWVDKSPSDFQSYFQIFAFDRNGRLVRKTMYPTFEDIKFPFYAGSLEDERLAQLSTALLKS